MEKKKVNLSLVVRFRDLDALGHVNNSVYLTYFEEGRIEFSNLFFGQVTDTSSLNFIQAHVSCDYVKPVKIGNRVRLQIWVNKIGRSSFVFGIRLVDRTDESIVYAKGKSVMVHYDFKKSCSIPLTDATKLFLSEYLDEELTV